MKTIGHVYLRINKNYVATIRDLNSLSSYLENVGDIDDTFGEIVEVSNVDDRFLNGVYRLIDKFKLKKNNESIGIEISVIRNQGERDAVVVAVSKDRFLIEYQMPNGSTALNVLKDLSRTENYKTITYKKALGSREFGVQLQNVELINNPQR
jgi:hypothetical protein